MRGEHAGSRAKKHQEFTARGFGAIFSLQSCPPPLERAGAVVSVSRSTDGRHPGRRRTDTWGAQTTLALSSLHPNTQHAQKEPQN